MTLRSALTLAVAVALAGAGTAAIAAGRHESPVPEPPLTVSPPVAVAPATGDALTRGRLLPTSPPTRIEIPALHVAAPVTGLGLQPDGSMAVPTDARTVGWFTKAPTPGSLGPAVLAGHVDFRGAEGAFARLATLRPGDRVRVTRADGAIAVFAVTHVDRYAKDHFPSDRVYGPIDHAGLRLITCGGDFDNRTGHYLDNIVAYADLR